MAFYVDEERKASKESNKPIELKVNPIGNSTGETHGIQNEKDDNKKKGKLLNDFWYMIGIAIATNPKETQKILSDFGFDSDTHEEMIDAVSYIYTTGEWQDFFKQFSPLLSKTTREIEETGATLEKESPFDSEVKKEEAEKKGGNKTMWIIIVIVILIIAFLIYRKYKNK